MKKIWSSWITLIALVVVLAGCGAAGGNGNTATSNTGTNEGSNTTAAAEGPITLKHKYGELTLDKPAVRVVALEWTLTEDLVALGVQPVGSADNENYKLWVSPEAALDSSVTDVGMRWEPNLEAIAALKPDLILSNSDNNAAIYEQLKAIAPTMEFNFYEGDGYNYDRMVDVFNEIAKAVGKTDEAAKVISDLDQHYIEAKQKLADAGKSDLHYVLTQAFTVQNAATLRLFADNSVVAGTLAKIGMINDWKAEKHEAYGFDTKGIEALPAVQDSNFIYITQKDDDVFGKAMKDNSVWKELNFVKENRLYALDGTSWTFGGPISSKVLVDQVVGELTK